MPLDLPDKRASSDQLATHDRISGAIGILRLSTVSVSDADAILLLIAIPTDFGK
jgi:hypothetical protein